MNWEEGLSHKLRSHNYYEYNGPLSDKSLFINRQKELEDSILVCERIIKGSIGGIFVVGGRASGKTTFITKLEEKLKNNNISTVFIPLDESMVRDTQEVVLFKTMISRTIMQLRERNLISHSIRDRLLNVIRNISTEVEVGIDIPGIKFLGKLNTIQDKTAGEQLNYFILKDAIDDILKLIEKEPGNKNGIIFIFDEGNVFLNNKEVLEVLRNVFQFTPKVGLVIAGTMNVIDGISKVFSPMARFFRKIELGPYPNENYVFEAVKLPLEKSTNELAKEGLVLKINYRKFAEDILEITKNMPMDINLLSHFAYDYSCQKFRQRESVIDLYFNLNKHVINSAIQELRGTIQYSTFLESLNGDEVNTLKLLSNSYYPLTTVELSTLIYFDNYGDKIVSIDINEMTTSLLEKDDLIEKTEINLKSIEEKGKACGLEIISKNIIGKPMYSINDQWIASYFKIGWAQQSFDIDKGFIPTFNGINMFYDPVSSSIHSMIFPRLYEYLKNATPFKVQTRKGISSKFKVPRGHEHRIYVIIDYKRTSDYLDYYYVFNFSPITPLKNIKNQINILLNCMIEMGIISNYNVTINE